MVNKKVLEEFLQNNGCHDIKGAMTPLEKFFQNAESGEYSLAKEEEIEQKSLMEAVALALDRRVSKILLISLDNSCFRPDWMTRELWDDSFYIKLWLNPGTYIENNLGETLWENLLYIFEINLGNNLLANLDFSIGDYYKKGLKHSICYYLGCCLLNDQEKIAKLRQLIEIWSQCLIFGFKEDEPETLLVACK